MLFNPAYDFPHVAKRIVMPEEQKPPEFAAAAQVAARVPEHYTGLSVKGFEEWKTQLLTQMISDSVASERDEVERKLAALREDMGRNFLKRPSKALGC